jgi:hypothetical protein
LPPSGIKKTVAIWSLRARLLHDDLEHFLRATVFRLVTLASLPGTFYPLFLYALYISIGPIFVGEIIPSSSSSHLNGNSVFGNMGLFYIYGFFLKGNWVPLIDTWLYGFFEISYNLAPLIIYLSFCVTPPEQLYAPKRKKFKTNEEYYYIPPPHNRRQHPLHSRSYVRLFVACCVFYQLITVFFIGLFYGPWAVIISPGKTWFATMACYLLIKHRWSSRGEEAVDLVGVSDE